MKDRLIFFFFLLISYTIKAQMINMVEDRASCNFTNIEQERLENLESLEFAESISIVTVNNPFNFVDGAILKFTIPDVEGQLEAEVINFEYLDEDNYTWSGNLVEDSGHVIFHKKDGHLGGFIQSNQKGDYYLHPINQEYSAFLANDLSDFTSNDFTDDNAESDNITSTTDLCDEENLECFETPRTITMMILVPDDVTAFLGDYSGNNPIIAIVLAGIAIETINVALRNSQIGNVSVDWFTEDAGEFPYDPLERYQKDLDYSRFAENNVRKKNCLEILF